MDCPMLPGGVSQNPQRIPGALGVHNKSFEFSKRLSSRFYQDNKLEKRKEVQERKKPTILKEADRLKAKVDEELKQNESKILQLSHQLQEMERIQKLQQKRKEERERRRLENTASVRIQRWLRQLLLMRMIIKHGAAMKIQKCYRMWCLVRAYKEKRRAIASIHRWFFDCRARRLRQKVEVRVIRPPRLVFVLLCLLNSTLIFIIKIYSHKRYFASVAIQRCLRRYLEKLHEMEREFQQKKAALVLQKFFLNLARSRAIEELRDELHSCWSLFPRKSSLNKNSNLLFPTRKQTEVQIEPVSKFSKKSREEIARIHEDREAALKKEVELRLARIEQRREEQRQKELIQQAEMKRHEEEALARRKKFFEDIMKRQREQAQRFKRKKEQGRFQQKLLDHIRASKQIHESQEKSSEDKAAKILHFKSMPEDYHKQDNPLQTEKGTKNKRLKADVFKAQLFEKSGLLERSYSFSSAESVGWKSKFDHKANENMQNECSLPRISTSGSDSMCKTRTQKFKYKLCEDESNLREDFDEDFLDCFDEENLLLQLESCHNLDLKNWDKKTPHLNNSHQHSFLVGELEEDSFTDCEDDAELTLPML